MVPMRQPGKPSLWRRIGGSLLLGFVFGTPVDVFCQLLVFRDIDRIYPPLFGAVAGMLVIFGFWNRLALIQFRGIIRSMIIGGLIGTAAGVLLGAFLYPPLKQAIEPRSPLFSVEEESELDRGNGAAIGLLIGGSIGTVAGGFFPLLRKPERACLAAPPATHENS